MADENKKIRYEIEVTKKGDGAKSTAQDLQQVEQAAKDAGKAVESIGVQTANSANEVTAATTKVAADFAAVQQAIQRTSKAITDIDPAAGVLVDDFKEVKQAVESAASPQIQADYKQFEAVILKLAESTQQTNNAVQQLAQSHQQAAEQTKQVDNEQKKTTQSGQGMVSMLTSVKGAYALIAGSAILKFLKDCTSAFLEEQAAVAKLEGSLRAAGSYSEAYSKTLQRSADQLENLTKVDNELILQNQALLISFRANGDEVERLTQLSLDLSAGMGRDLGSSTQLLTHALNGNFDVFKKLGVVIDDNATRSEKFASVIQQLEGRFGGLSKSVGQSGGEFGQLKQTFGDLAKAIGSVINDVLAPAVKGLTRLIGDLAEGVKMMRSGTAWEVFSSEWTRNRLIVEQLQADAARKKVSEDPVRLLDPEGVARQRQQLEAELARTFSARIYPNSFYRPYTQKELENGTKASDPERLKPLVDRPLEKLRPMDKDLPTFTSPKDLDQLRYSYLKQTNQATDQLEEGMLSVSDYNEYFQKLTDVYQQGWADIAAIGIGAQDEVMLASMTSKEREKALIRRHYEEMGSYIDAYYAYELEKAQGNEERIAQLMERRDATVKQMNENLKKDTSDFYQDMNDLKDAFKNGFAAGFSDAFVEVIKGTKEAKEAFKDFAASLLSDMAKLAMQKAILNILGGIFPSASGSAWVKAASGGSMVKAASGMAGVAELTRPTYLPNWNVMAGEAGGSEMMTVLSNPKTWSVGGAAVISGSVGPSRLAMMAEQDFQRFIPAASGVAMGGAPSGQGLAGNGTMTGTALVRISLDRNLEAQIVENSVKQAKIEIVSDMSQDSDLSAATKRLVS